MNDTIQKNIRAAGILSFLVLAGFAFSGCSSAPEIDTAKVNAAWASGNAAEAYKHYEPLEIEDDNDDRLCFFLEKGTLALTAGTPESVAESAKNYGWAVGVIGGIDNGPVFAVSDMFGKAYRGTNTERIMLGVMSAIALMESGDFGNAEAMLNKTNIYQDSASAKNERALAASEKKAKDSVLDENIEKISVEKALELLPQDVRDNLAKSAPSAIWTNPYAYWFGGVCRLGLAESSDEKEAARKFFEKAVASNGGKSAFLANELAVAEKVADGASVPAATYIICENGSIAKRGYDDYEIPVAFMSLYIQAVARKSGLNLGETPFPNMTVRIPKLVPAEKIPSPVDVPGAKFETLVDLDAMKTAEFEQSKPGEITSNIIKASIACVARFVAQEVAAKAAASKFGGFGSTAVAATALVATPAFPVEMRGWETLPREISVAKISTPDSGKISVAGKEIALKRSGVNIIRVRNVAGTPIVSSFSLGK